VTLAYYVSGHGLGHAARACTVIGALPVEVPLIVRSAAPAWFFASELTMPYELVPGATEAGLVHADSITIDRRASLQACAEFQTDEQRVEREAAFLRERGVRLVVSDAAALPLLAAERAGIPSALVCNFTWADIYRPFAEELGSFGETVAELERAYQRATVAYVTELCLDMPYLERVLRVPLIARRGARRRGALAQTFGLDADALWLLYYPGAFGLSVDFTALESVPGLRILAFSPLEGGPRNLTVIDRDRFPHPDLVASVDVVVSKPGYMLAGECMTAGTPLILVPRQSFAEDRVLVPALEAWGGLCSITPADFAAGAWHDAIERARSLRPAPYRNADGAELVATRLYATYRELG
jgi:hypothetical protein